MMILRKISFFTLGWMAVMFFVPRITSAQDAKPAICDLTRPDCGIASPCCDGDYGVDLSNCGTADTETDDVWYIGWELKYCGSTVDSGCEPLEDAMGGLQYNIEQDKVCSMPDNLPLAENITLSCSECGNRNGEWTVTIWKGDNPGDCSDCADDGDCDPFDTKTDFFIKGLCQCNETLCVGCCTCP